MDIHHGQVCFIPEIQGWFNGTSTERTNIIMPSFNVTEKSFDEIQNHFIIKKYI